MSDIVVTAANVLQDTSTETGTGFATSAIVAGQLIGKSAALGTWAPFDADAAAAAASPTELAIAISSAPGAGQPVNWQKIGDITIGGTVVSGTMYSASVTAGGILIGLPATTTNFVMVGVGISTTKIRLNLKNFAIAAV